MRSAAARHLDGVRPSVALPRAHRALEESPARPACRRRSPRPPRPAGSRAPRPAPRPSSRGPVPRSRRRTITCGARAAASVARSAGAIGRSVVDDEQLVVRLPIGAAIALRAERRHGRPITDSSFGAGSTIETKGRPSARPGRGRRRRSRVSIAASPGRHARRASRHSRSRRRSAAGGGARRMAR